MQQKNSERPINELFLELTHYVAEDIIPEAEEIRIIDIEEKYRETGIVNLSDIIWLKRLLKELKDG